MRAAVLIILAITAGACLDAIEPDVGAPLRESCEGEDSDPGTDVSYSADIYAGIFSRSEIACVDCHTATGSNPIGLEASAFDLASYDTLRSGGNRTGPDIIVPGAPCESRLLFKVRPGPPAGARMPLGGPPYLSIADEQLLIDWIAEGALDN